MYRRADRAGLQNPGAKPCKSGQPARIRASGAGHSLSSNRNMRPTGARPQDTLLVVRVRGWVVVDAHSAAARWHLRFRILHCLQEARYALAEVVVQGAGIIGCAVAYELARRGARVTVIDAREPGQGATQASAGVLAPFIEAPEDTVLQRLCVESLGLYETFITRLRGYSGMDVEYRRTGTLEVALDEAEAEHLEAAARALDAKGVRAELLNAADAAAVEPALAPASLSALFVPEHGYVSAPVLTQALAAAAKGFGATFHTRTRVERIEREGDSASGSGRPGAGGLRIETSIGTLRASAVVCASGSWAGQVDTPNVSAPMPVRPVRGQMLYLRWRGATPPSRVIWGSRCYIVPWSDGTLLVGATVEEVGFAEETTVAGVRTLIEAARELLPETHAAEFIQARVGLRPASSDSLPVIGEWDELPGLFFATGHYRNGILLAPLTAQMIADELLEHRRHPLLAATAPGRFRAAARAHGA
jgi:glycine oxidase